MSDAGDSGGEKSFEPTTKKLEEARRKGDVVRSQDVSAAASYLGLILAFVFVGPGAVSGIGKIFAQMLGNADDFSKTLLSDNGGAVATELVIDILVFLAPILGLPALAVVLSIAAQQSFVVSVDKLSPKLSRISPISVAKNKFGPTGLVEFVKSLTKLIAISVVVGFFITANASFVFGSIFAPANSVAVLLSENLTNLLLLIFAIAAGISVADYLWQDFDHKRKLKMSRQEMIDEAKNAEGDPHLKQARRQRGYDIATQRMLADVPLASVIIVNPVHFSVALKWEIGSPNAPVCVAKGVDEIAARIREIAAENGVPIHHDPPTARALFAVVDVGTEVQPKHYKPVAVAIRFAEKVRGMARKA